MSLILNARGKRATAKAVAAENVKHHVYGRAPFAEGFVSPIVLPSDRLRDIRGDMDLQQFASYTGLSEFELDYLLSNDNVEPTEKQLMTLTNQTGLSVMWLLGYHVPPEKQPRNGDSEIYIAIGKRNAAEDTLRKLPPSGVLNGFIRSNVSKRIEAADREVASAAARIVARLHHPMDNRDIMWMKGQPVYVEFLGAAPGEGVWGISTGSAILTENGELALTENQESFYVYQTPKN